MGNKSSVFKNSILYTIGNMLLKAFSFFLIPLYTAYLSTEEYGIINLASGFYTLAASLISLGLQYAVIRYYADYKSDNNKVAKMNGTVITFIIILGVVLTMLSVLLKDFVATHFFSGIDFFPAVFLSILISVVSAIYTVYQDILKGMQNARMSVILSYVFFFVLLSGNIFTVVILKMGANGILLSTLIVYSIMMVIMFVDLLNRKLITLGIDSAILKDMMKYSIPLVPHTIAFNLQNYATKAIIGSKLSMAMLGIYGLAAQFGSISDVIVNSVQSAFQPWMFSVLNEKSEKNKNDIRQSTYILMWLYGFMFFLIGIFSQEAVLIMADEKYKGAWFYVPLIVATFSIKAPLYFFLNYLYYDKKKTKYIFTSTVVASIVNILLTFLLVPSLQVLGSIIADLVAIIVRTIITLFYSKAEIKDTISLCKIELMSLIPICFIGIGLLFSIIKYRETFSLINISYKIGISLVYITILLMCNKRQLPLLKKILNRRRG